MSSRPTASSGAGEGRVPAGAAQPPRAAVSPAVVRPWLGAREYVGNIPPGAAASAADRLHLTAEEVAGLWVERGWPEAWAAGLTDAQLAMLEAYGGDLGS